MDKANLETIAIAWNGSTQSARAVHAALPLLQQARRIAILRVDDADAAGEVDRIEPDEFLRRHGLRCEHFDLQGRADDAGAALLAGAARIFADMLVLGAYGTGRFSEWIFGGVTRHVLQHVALPLFMRH
jgi:nucleotide-binding universal stress UspA family protein